MKALDCQEVALLPDELKQKYFGRCPNLLFARMGVHGDGSCFFHSLCAARNTSKYLYRSPKHQQNIGQKFRDQFCTFVTDARWDAFKRRKGITEQLNGATLRDRFRDSRFWADENMIKFVSEVLKLNLIFIDTTNNKIYCGVRGNKDEPLILILWLNHSHFEPLFCIRDADLGEKRLATQFTFDMTKDSDILNSVMSNYELQCDA